MDLRSGILKKTTLTQFSINPLQLTVSQAKSMSQASHRFMTILEIKKHKNFHSQLSISHTIGAERLWIIQILHICCYYIK